MSEHPIPATRMTRGAVAPPGPQACVCGEQALSPAFHDLLRTARHQTHAAGRSLV